MIAAIITSTLALGTLIVAFLVLTLDLRDAERRVGDARVDAQTKAGQLAIAESDAATQRARADSEKRRADALDDLIAQHASGPVDGAYQRLLQDWRSARSDPNPTSGERIGTVSAASAPTASGSINVPDGPNAGVG